MTRPSKFAHVVYSTTRYEEMIDWYEKVFDAKVVYKNPLIAFATYDEEHHRFAFINLKALDKASIDSGERRVGVNHVAYTFASLRELLENYERLKQMGITPYWRIHHGMTMSLYYRDPDGNRMEFQIDCFAAAEDANAFMLSDAFAANPIGVDIDPDEMLARYRDGVPLDQLMVYPDGPISPIPAAHGLPAVG